MSKITDKEPEWNGPTKLQVEADLEVLTTKYAEKLAELQSEVGFLAATFNFNKRDSWGLKLRVLGVADVAMRLTFLTAKLDALVDLSRKYR